MTGAVPLVVSARGEPGTAVKVIRAPGRGEVNGGRRRRAREKAAAALGVSALLAAVPLACFFFLLFLFGTAPDVERKGRKGQPHFPRCFGRRFLRLSVGGTRACLCRCRWLQMPEARALSRGAE